MAIFKEIFAEHMQVKAVKVELRPFGKTSADPKVVTSTAYLRMPIIGHVKHWVVHAMEDLREMSFSQINKSLEVDNWMITVYGQDVGAEPAPSRLRRIPELPPRQDDAEILARIQERPEGHQAPALQDSAYEEEEFEAQDRRELAPIKPNYNLRWKSCQSLWLMPTTPGHFDFFLDYMNASGTHRSQSSPTCCIEQECPLKSWLWPKKRCYRVQCAENTSGCQMDLG